MKFIRLVLGIIAGYAMITNSVKAATCSCAGVTLSNNISLSNFESEQLQVSISFTNTDISDLVAGKHKINDETNRFRETDSTVIQGVYGINDQWAIIGIGSYIEHRRNIATSNTRVEESSGVGDSLLVIGYAPQKIDPFTRDEWAFGLGLRIPTGKDSNGTPIVFAEDLQPSQGAWGRSLWFHYGHAFRQKAELVFFSNINYSQVGENDREYSFGSEWNLSAGINYAINEQWYTSSFLNYRDASSHTRFGNNFPNTGGQWLDFSLSAQYSLTPSASIVLSSTFPVSRNLNGALQFTTKRSFTLSLNYRFD